MFKYSIFVKKKFVFRPLLVVFTKPAKSMNKATLFAPVNLISSGIQSRALAKNHQCLIAPKMLSVQQQPRVDLMP